MLVCILGDIVLTYLSSNSIIDVIYSSLSSSSSCHQIGVTALMYAADRGYEDTVKLLLDRGASAETKDNVSTRRCITTHMHVYIKLSMRWMNIVRRILTRWNDMRWDDCW